MTPPAPVVLYNPASVFYTMPLALLALASALKDDGVPARIIDGRLVSNAPEVVANAARHARVCGISVLTGAPIHDALVVSRAVKQAAPGCTVVWGGWHPSLFTRDCLADPAVDAVAFGQGEDTLREIVRRVDAGESLEGCAGAAVRGAGGVVFGPSRPLRELDQLPAHDYDLLPVERYFELKGQRQIDYISSQGCRFRCAFCADPAVYGRSWTGLSPDRVAGEVEQLIRRYGMRDLAFQDETFFTHVSRVEELCEHVLRRGLQFTWTATLRADQAHRMNSELFDLCVRAGLRRVMVGVESGSQATLDRLRKDMRLEHVLETARRCAMRHVGAIFNFIVGFPDEPPDSVDATLALAKRLRAMHPDFETPVFYYRPYPGNPLSAEAASRGYQFPVGLEGWAAFDYVGSRGPWVSEALWRRVERFKFYTRHAFQRGAWRWPIRVAARWRCDHDCYTWPVEKAVVEWLRPPQQVS